jgi:hypothetical protein
VSARAMAQPATLTMYLQGGERVDEPVTPPLGVAGSGKASGEVDPLFGRDGE